MALQRFPMTVNGAARLQEELQRLKAVDRPNVIAAIAEARAHGDLSENAEYDAAKERQGFIEGRIKAVEAKLSTSQVIDPLSLKGEDRVVFAATVDLEDLDSSNKITYQIVGEDEADIKVGKVSVNSPIARALIGKNEGDVVVLTTPGGQRELEVLAIRFV